MDEQTGRPTTGAKGVRLAIVGISLILYAAACLVPALHFDKTTGEQQIMKGWEVALLGWQAVLIGNFGWGANPILILAWVLLLLGSGRIATVCGGLAVVFALMSLMLLGKTIPADEGGVTHMVLSRLYIGFYLWVASMAVFVAASITRWRAAPTDLFGGEQTPPRQV
jgi:hypothetical protein